MSSTIGARAEERWSSTFLRQLMETKRSFGARRVQKPTQELMYQINWRNRMFVDDRCVERVVKN